MAGQKGVSAAAVSVKTMVQLYSCDFEVFGIVQGERIFRFLLEIVFKLRFNYFRSLLPETHSKEGYGARIEGMVHEHQR